MADRNAWEPLLQNLAKFFPNISPQIIPGNHNARMVLQAIQSGLDSSHETRTQSEVLQAIQSGLDSSHENRTQSEAQCKWCGRVVSSDQEGFYIPDGSTVPEERKNVSILTWQLDWTKRILKIKELQFSCQDCQLLLNLSKLLNFLLMLNNSTDNTKLYSVASHFCQINGHTSQSGEDDVGLLQQAVSVTHSLHVLTKNMPDLTIQGPNGEIITLDSVNEVVEYLSRPQVHDSIQSSTSKPKRKKTKESTSTIEANNALNAHDSMPELKTSNKKKKKRRTIQGSLTNGRHTSDQEKGIPEGPAKKYLVLSEKRKKNPAGKVKLGKKRRSLPAMKLD